jgi:flagellin
VPSVAAGASQTLQFASFGLSVTFDGTTGTMTPADLIAQLTQASNDTIVINGSSATSTLQIGANVPDTITLSFTNLQSDQLGSGAYKLGGSAGLAIDATTAVKDIASAHQLMAAADGAIQVLNSQRGTLGAAQNRLEHSINSIGVAVENLGASESRIRDADIAALSSELVTTQILQQAGVSVLSQANQAPQAILQLLRGG